MQVEIINHQGQVIRQVSLNSEIWKTPYSSQAVSLSTRSILANKRQGTSKVKKRGEVKGSGVKIWKQKGTGRARHGSRYAPQFRGGGIAFGPTGKRNYSLDVNRKYSKLALRSLLSEKLRLKELFIIEGINLNDFKKTKEANTFLEKLPLKSGKTLLILEKNKSLLSRAFRNIPKVEINDSRLVNITQIVFSSNVIFTYEALIEIEKRMN